MNTYVKIRGVIRAPADASSKSVFVVESPRLMGQTVTREHVNVRTVDFEKDCRVVGNIGPNTEVLITCVMEKYISKNQIKTGLSHITKIERV